MNTQPGLVSLLLIIALMQFGKVLGGAGLIAVI